MISFDSTAQDKAGEWLWWEAENYSASSGVHLQEDEMLSGDAWISIDETESDQPRYVEYDEITVTVAGVYQLYARKFWTHGPYTWSFGESELAGHVSREIGVIDTETLSSGDIANWSWAGEVHLEEGIHKLRILVDRSGGAAKFDAFVLTRVPFSFRGQHKPGDTVEAAEPGWFSWNYLTESDEQNAIDLRYLNESYAGEHGFIQASGDHFIHAGNGETVRFWGSSVGKEIVRLDNYSMELFARDMAKYGVNLIRVHFPLYDARGVDLDEMNYSDLERLHYFVYVLKAQGIYVTLSAYFPLWTRLGPDDERFPGYNGDIPFSTLFYDPDFQGVYQGWLRDILTPINPYTQVALTDESAIHSVELVNEDSLLFWSFSEENIPEESLGILEERYTNWLIDSFASLESVERRWGGFNRRLDNPSEGRIGFIPLYDIREGRGQRAKDTVHFLTEVQMGFFSEQYDFLKQELGFRSMVSASNWVTASGEFFGPLDKYSNTIGDFMDRHAYFEPYHESVGDRTARYSLQDGHRYRDRSALLFEGSGEQSGQVFASPFFDITYNDMPSVISEINWPTPNRFRADMPFLQATYARMQGMDAIINFESIATPWVLEQDKFSTHSPLIKGQWPAAALAFRRGDVSEGDIIAEVDLPLEGHLYELAGSPISLQPNLDRLRENANKEDIRLPFFHPLNFLRGKVKINFLEVGQPSVTYDRLFPIDTQRRTAVSTNRELLWNYMGGFSTVNTPRLQGVAGFLAEAGSLEFENFSIDSSMTYGSVLLVSLDGLDLSDSTNMLLQIVSEEKNYGWSAESDGENFVITELGRSPMLMKNFEGRVAILNNDNDLSITVLDQNGNKYSEMPYDGPFNLEPNVVYYQISRR